jgi:putative phosphoesterase
MIVVLSDTHRHERPGLAGPLAEAVTDADRVIHAGDFTTEAVLDGFQERSEEFFGVTGNRDDPAVAQRLPSARTVTLGPITAAVTHRQEGGETGLRYFGEERDADLVVSGHTHAPHVLDGEGPLLLNPGSHADPRGGTATYATLERAGDGLDGAIHATSGTVEKQFRVEGRNGAGTGMARGGG